MKKTIFLALFTIFVAGFSVRAQDIERYSSGRLDNLSNQLKRQTVDLVDRTDEDLRRGGSVSRREIEAAFLARQLDSSAGLFDEMVRERHRAADLRDAASILTELARRAPNFGSSNVLWRNVQNSINDINRELGRNQGGGGNNNGGGNNDGPISGRAYWRGTVDDVVQLEIRGRDINVRNISGRAYNNGTFSFTAALPTRSVTVGINKRSGRGNVEVIQQPRRDNDYTAIIEIRDRDSGARDYQLEIFWQ
jgi:hypothetical protein